MGTVRTGMILAHVIDSVGQEAVAELPVQIISVAPLEASWETDPVVELWYDNFLAINGGVPTYGVEFEWLSKTPGLNYTWDNDTKLLRTVINTEEEGFDDTETSYTGVLRTTITDAAASVVVLDLAIDITLEEILVWTEGRALQLPSNILNNVSYGNDTYVSGWWGAWAERSADGLTWTPGSIPMNLSMNSEFGQGMFIITGEQSNNSGPGRIATSANNGVSWTLRTLPFTEYSQANNVIRSIAFSPELDLWMITARGGGYKTSSDGLTWSALQTFPSDFSTLGASGKVAPKVSWAEGRFIVHNGKNVIVSEDGTNWTLIGIMEDSIPLLGADRIQRMTIGNGVIVAVGRTTSSDPARAGVYSTNNGATWHRIALDGEIVGFQTDFDGLAYGDGMFVAITWAEMLPSRLIKSVDGMSWVVETGYPNTNEANGSKIVYAPDRREFLAVYDRGWTALGERQVIIPPEPV